MKTIKHLFMLIVMMCTATSAWAEKEAYVVLTYNDDPEVELSGMDPGMTNFYQAQTLTFYYDEEKSSRGWNTYSVNTDYPGWTQATNYAAPITRVVFDPSFADYQPTTCYHWFFQCMNLHTITGIEYLNTSLVTNMEGMFYDCEKLTTIDLSHFNTSSVTNMEDMFYMCKKFTTLDLSYFNTSNVTTMREMFGYCSELQKIYVGEDWNTDKVTTGYNMFYNCTELVGGNGTTYYDSSSGTDLTRACVDAPGTQGYLRLRIHPSAYFYYEGNLLFEIPASKTDGTVTLPTKAELMNKYYIKNVSYTYSGGAFTAETVVTEDVDVTVTATSIIILQTIGETAGSYSSECPYKTGYYYTTTQNIYEASEMGGAATIKGIAFKVGYTSDVLKNTSVEIYLGHKSAANTTFTSTYNYMTSSNLTRVYSGRPTLGKKSGWEMLEFNLADFDYNGTDNLVVVVCRESASSNNVYYYYETKTDHVLQRGSTSSSNKNYSYISNTSNYSLSNKRPCAQFMTVKYSAQEYELTDAGDYTVTKNTEVASATYKKTLAEDRVGKYQAWFIPFEYAITAADLEKFDFFKINMIANAAQPGENPASDDVYIFLNPMAAGDVLYGNKPYVYRPKEAVTDYEFTTDLATLHAKTDASVLQTSTTTATYDFYGTYADTEATTENPFYYVSVNGNICKGTTVTVGPYRWILKATSKGGASYAPTFSFMENGTTGINEVQDSGFKVQGSEAFYNLNGQRVAQPTKGLYIVNGKKVVIK